jgi:hypothetical protein
LVLPDRKAAAEEEEERNKAALDANPNARVNVHHANFLKTWWQMSYSRQEMIRVLSTLRRYVVCSRVTKRPIFVFLTPEMRPNDSLQVFAFEDDDSFGILSSAIHWQWFVAQCSTLTGRFRYTSNTVFDTFPWPQSPNIAQVRAVGDAGKALRAERARILRENSWSLRELYRSAELPGRHPLKTAQHNLDAAVRVAYGMEEDDEALQALLALNQSLVARQESRQRVIGPGLLALGGEFADALDDLVSDDSVTRL